MSGKPLLEFALEDSEILEALKRVGVSRMVVLGAEGESYRYPEGGEFADLRTLASSLSIILGDTDPWLALRQGSKTVLIARLSKAIAVVEGEVAPADYELVVMLLRLLLQ